MDYGFAGLMTFAAAVPLLRALGWSTQFFLESISSGMKHRQIAFHRTE